MPNLVWCHQARTVLDNEAGRLYTTLLSGQSRYTVFHEFLKMWGQGVAQWYSMDLASTGHWLTPPMSLSVSKILRIRKEISLCNSLFLYSLQLEDVHGLCVARRREEHAVHAEGQRANAHTPVGQGT